MSGFANLLRQSNIFYISKLKISDIIPTPDFYLLINFTQIYPRLLVTEVIKQI